MNDYYPASICVRCGSQGCANDCGPFVCNRCGDVEVEEDEELCEECLELELKEALEEAGESREENHK